jgi:PncC family amidohydrolase
MADNLDLISSKAGELVSVAALEGITVGFAESLTGGMISSSVVAVPGSSAVLKGSIVSYTNEVKEKVLGVSPDIISAHTEVSAECAKAMAEGAKSVLGVDLAVSVTGIAGPTGELPGKPVGTVYMGYCFRDISGALRLNFEGDRDTIRTCTVLEALNQAISLIKEGKA